MFDVLMLCLLDSPLGESVVCLKGTVEVERAFHNGTSVTR